jgi:iron complex transport system ATP-binding protein
MSRGAAIVSVRDLSFAYEPRGREVLQGISLDIAEGTVTAILGPNGSGKTTLLNLLLGWSSPDKGWIELAGKSRASYSRRELSRMVGMVPQHEHVTFDLNVFEYTLLGRAPYLAFLEMPGENDRRLALQALEATGLASLKRRPIPSLSGGELQLATLARALVQEPRILLLDEPLSHLDIANIRRILQVLDRMRKDGKTVVLTTHDPNVASAVADSVVLLREGRLMASGPATLTLNTEHLSATYGVEVDVIEVGGRPVVVTRI